MNDLLSRSFSQHRENNAGDIEMGLSPDSEANLERFFQDVAKINDELKDIEELHRKLKAGHEESKTAHNAGVVKALRSRMDTDVNQTLKKAKLIKDRLQVLDRSNAASRKLPDCGPGSSTDRTRTSVVAGLGKKLKDKMEEFQELRGKINEEYRETVERRYYTVTGENPDEKTVDLLISTGESETFLQKAIQQQVSSIVCSCSVFLKHVNCMKYKSYALVTKKKVFEQIRPYQISLILPPIHLKSSI